MMSGIRGADTRPELTIRRLLHRQGFRYRLHARGLPGRPDLVFPARHAVIFVHGCFWHGHVCPLFKWPATRAAFWKEKISGNRVRDAKNLTTLAALGWRTLVIWECALRGPGRRSLEDLTLIAAGWLRSSDAALVIRGINHG